MIVLVLIGGWRYRWAVQEAWREANQEPLPTPINYVEKQGIKDRTDDVVKPAPQITSSDKEQDKILDEINLAVPFAPQAPHANWDQPYQDACEEAAVIMVAYYISGGSLNTDKMDSEILKMVAWEEKVFGFFKDTNIAETTKLVNKYYPKLSAQAHYDISVTDIKRELSLGKAVVVLANGRQLNNPYYTAPGPEKHALVIKGFTGDKFVTNDPGTKRGADYVYPTQRVYRAIVDYDGGSAGTGKKAMIIMSGD